MATDSPQRRSRFERSPTGKRIEIGSRDITILHWLYRYRYLDSGQLITIIKPKSAKRFIERLGDLFHETGLINRPAVQATRFDARAKPMLYEISNMGIAYLSELGKLPHRAVTFSRRSRSRYHPQFLHTTQVINAVLAVELQTLATSDQRFVPVDEILARAPATTQRAKNPLSIAVTLLPTPEHPIIRARKDTHVIPDALYGIEYVIEGEKRYRFFALECERTSPKARSHAEASSKALKIAAYDALIKAGGHKGHWGIPNLKLEIVSGEIL
jgi:hypothetical protein